MDYARILPALFVGSCPKQREDIERLKRAAGISAVLNLQTDSDMQHFSLDWESLLSCYRELEIELRRLPVRDFDAADLEAKLPACVSSLAELLSLNHTVYLHCSAGAGRSPTVAAAYLCVSFGWDLEAAIAHLQQCRPCAPNRAVLRALLAGRA
ncbi:MAG TPA: dual specificity protein phosphatase family protein [Candidatus Acidoferrales bacterium]|nr:dual specificity protein phosphatase family protein [Candidatus Acidoferrales bacterium]